jgi:hypothetical protein
MYVFILTIMVYSGSGSMGRNVATSQGDFSSRESCLQAAEYAAKPFKNNSNVEVYAACISK